MHSNRDTRRRRVVSITQGNFRAHDDCGLLVCWAVLRNVDFGRHDVLTKRGASIIPLHCVTYQKTGILNIRVVKNLKSRIPVFARNLTTGVQF